MASVRTLPSGKHQGIAKHPSGKRSTRTFPLKRQALKWAQDVEAGWCRGSVRDPRAGRLTLGDWYALWLPARVVADTTAEREQRIHARFVLPQWRSWPMEEITRIAVRGWIVKMGEQGVSPQQVHLAYYGLSAMLRDAADEDPPLILSNPCARVPLPKLPEPADRFFSPAEMAAILAELVDPWRTMVELSLWSGLRWEELAGLHASEVAWLRGQAQVVNVRTRFGCRPYPKSDKSGRWVPVPPAVMASMSALMVGRADAPPPAACALGKVHVFADAAGAPCKYTTWLWNFRQAVGRAGVTWAPPHTLRHTAASWLTEKGVDQYRIQGLLGHESARTTARYSHLDPHAHGKIREAWARIDEEFGRTSGAREVGR